MNAWRRAVVRRLVSRCWPFSVHAQASAWRRAVCGYGTHLPMLMACATKTQGAILELGAGFTSTPVLHAAFPGRRIVTVDVDKDWLRTFEHLRSESHSLVWAPGWECQAEIDKDWAVALIDHGPDEPERCRDIARLRGRAEFLVVHDTESPVYGYEPLLSSFKYRFDDHRSSPWTTVVSDLRNVEFLKALTSQPES